jgi:hypothetical protein
MDVTYAAMRAMTLREEDVTRRLTETRALKVAS